MKRRWDELLALEIAVLIPFLLIFINMHWHVFK